MNDIGDLRERLSRAKSIAINGITLSRTSNTYLDIFINCLVGGDRVRILIIDPENDATIELAANRSRKHDNVRKIEKACEQSLNYLGKLYLTNRDTVPVRLCKTVPPFGIWLIDADTPDAEIWVEIYSYRGDCSPTFQLLPKRDDLWFKFFQNQFEELWENGIDWLP